MDNRFYKPGRGPPRRRSPHENFSAGLGREPAGRRWHGRRCVRRAHHDAARGCSAAGAEPDAAAAAARRCGQGSAHRAAGRPDQRPARPGNRGRGTCRVPPWGHGGRHRPSGLRRRAGPRQCPRPRARARDGAVYSGPELELRVQRFEGYFLEPEFEFTRLGAGGRADRVDFLGSSRARATNASYTSCPRDGPEEPDWVLRTRRVTLDFETNEGVAEGAVLYFLGAPILALPTLSFPLTDARKSGWLPPSVNIDNRSGVELAVPYYWNIAPNRDATIAPRVMSRRGFGLDAEFRYLEPAYEGGVLVQWLPHDQTVGRSREALEWTHEGRLGVGLRYSADVARVSDDDWWKDFPDAGRSLTAPAVALAPGAGAAVRAGGRRRRVLCARAALAGAAGERLRSSSRPTSAARRSACAWAAQARGWHYELEIRVQPLHPARRPGPERRADRPATACTCSGRLSRPFARAGLVGGAAAVVQCRALLQHRRQLARGRRGRRRQPRDPDLQRRCRARAGARHHALRP